MNLSIISTEQIVPPARYSAGAPYRQVNSTFAEERKKHDQEVQQHQSCMWSAGNVAAICRNRNRATVLPYCGDGSFYGGPCLLCQGERQKRRVVLDVFSFNHWTDRRRVSERSWEGNNTVAPAD